MRKIILLSVILLCGIGVSQTTKEGLISFSDSYDHDIFKMTGKRIFNKGMRDVKFNGEVIATIEGYVWAYSLKDGLLTLAAEIYYVDEDRYINMYTIDIESKEVKKKERLNMKTHKASEWKISYKDSDLELSISEEISDDYDFYNTATGIMQYTWKGKTNRVVLSADEKWMLTSNSNKIYISKNGFLVVCDLGNFLYVFSMDKKKFTHLGRFLPSCCSYSYFCIPLNEYVVYLPMQDYAPSKKVFLYRYAEEELYATRYQDNVIGGKIKDTIELNIKNGNIYEQFLPLTRIGDIDSMLYASTVMEVEMRLKKDTAHYKNYIPDSIAERLKLNARLERALLRKNYDSLVYLKKLQDKLNYEHKRRWLK